MGAGELSDLSSVVSRELTDTFKFMLGVKPHLSGLTKVLIII